MLCSPEKHVAARARIKCCFWGAASAHHRYQNLDFQDQKMHLNCKDEVLAFWRQTYEICCPLKTHSMVPQPSPTQFANLSHMCTDGWDSWCVKLHFLHFKALGSLFRLGLGSTWQNSRRGQGWWWFRKVWKRRSKLPRFHTDTNIT